MRSQLLFPFPLFISWSLIYRKILYFSFDFGKEQGQSNSFNFWLPDFEQAVSPVSVAHFSQYKLMKLLAKQLQALSFNIFTPENCKDSNNWSFGGSKLLMGHECVSIDATDRLVTVTTSFVEDGRYMERIIPCHILVGADGAGSTVRKLVGINMQGETNLQKLISIHFMSRELGQYLINERPGMLFFIFNTEAIGVLVAHDLKQGEFVLQVTEDPKFHFTIYASALITVIFQRILMLLLQAPETNKLVI